MRNMTIHIYETKAFRKSSDGGNPAGVVLLEQPLGTSQMQNIATQVGFSETAFVKKLDPDNFEIQFFTPKTEIDLCGHATIAAFTLLLDKQLVQINGSYQMHTKVGKLTVEIKADQTIVMDQTLPEYLETVPTIKLAPALQIPESEIKSSNLIPQIVSTGYPDIMGPVSSLKTLLDLKPNLDLVSKLNEDTKTTGLHVFTTKTDNSRITAYCRDFSPFYGIPEDPATGGSSGALACYLFKYHQLSNPQEITFYQGKDLTHLSEINVALTTKDEEITRVQVGGKAEIIKEYDLTI